MNAKYTNRRQAASTLIAELTVLVCFSAIFIAMVYTVATDRDHCTICGAYAPCYNHNVSK